MPTTFPAMDPHWVATILNKMDPIRSSVDSSRGVAVVEQTSTRVASLRDEGGGLDGQLLRGLLGGLVGFIRLDGRGNVAGAGLQQYAPPA